MHIFLAILVVVGIVVIFNWEDLRYRLIMLFSKAPVHPEMFKNAEENLIRSRMSYYGLLDKDEKAIFLARTLAVMDSLIFSSPESGFIVTDEMRILVSASVTQVTFGWTEIKSPDLNEISLVSVGRSEQMHTAFEAMDIPHVVTLSWKYFQEGYQIDNDKINLGLHELAYSIWDETFLDFKSRGELQPWIHVAGIELQKMQRHIDSGFFRSNAASSIQELWACSVECFFEAPIEFQQKLPDLYSVMADVLNQDMAERMRRTSMSAPSPAV
jgi:hypothetical protein